MMSLRICSGHCWVFVVMKGSNIGKTIQEVERLGELARLGNEAEMRGAEADEWERQYENASHSDREQMEEIRREMMNMVCFLFFFFSSLFSFDDLVF